MRRKTYGWLELRQQTEGLEIQADMAEMELRMVNAYRRLVGLPPSKNPAVEWRVGRHPKARG